MSPERVKMVLALFEQAMRDPLVAPAIRQGALQLKATEEEALRQAKALFIERNRKAVKKHVARETPKQTVDLEAHKGGP